MEDDPNTLSEAEVLSELDRLFPQGLAGPDVVTEIVADGWKEAPDPARVREWLGKCLWEVFSDNHEVMAADGRVFDLGSFRYAGELIADWMNAQVKRKRYDYMDCYLGTVWFHDLNYDFSPIHRLIFRRLKSRGMDWVYHFPELHVIDFRQLRDALPEEGGEWESYSPEAALAKEREEAERTAKINELREQLKKDRRKDMAEARKQPPPAIVEAYRAVYGKLPRGWPPVD